VTGWPRTWMKAFSASSKRPSSSRYIAYLRCTWLGAGVRLRVRGGGKARARARVRVRAVGLR